jgi:hypothetical protein
LSSESAGRFDEVEEFGEDGLESIDGIDNSISIRSTTTTCLSEKELLQTKRIEAI